MLSNLNAGCPRVLILKTDKLSASVLAETVEKVIPGARIQRESTLQGALGQMEYEAVDLLVTGVSLPDGDALDLLGDRPGRQRFRRALVVTGRWEHRLLAILRVLPIHGVYDSNTEDRASIETAMRLVAKGERYWSASVLERLCRDQVPANSINRMLSPTEHLVFAVIGDGCDDKAAAKKLNLRPSTIHSVRRELHRKLGVQHKGELVRLAVRYGYVRITATGVQRPGFSTLLAACNKQEASITR
jgi:two-component system response regulator NreC